MKRTPFKRKVPPLRPSRQYEGANPSAARAPAVRVADTRDRIVVPIAKGPKARPGKGAPTKAERAWMDSIVAYGCIACHIDGHGFVAPAVHHILRGGVRMGHLFTLPLCDPGHHAGGAPLGKVSRHPWKARFERRYGDEAALLAKLRHLLGSA